MAEHRIDEQRTLAVLGHDGMELTVALTASGEATVVHWGRPLPGGMQEWAQRYRAGIGALPRNTLDERWTVGLAPTAADGWLGEPALDLRRAGKPVVPEWTEAQWSSTDRQLDVALTDPKHGVRLSLLLSVGEGGLLGITHRITNLVQEPLDVGTVVALMPVPDLATEVFDFAGRWAKERVEQRGSFAFGTHRRASRRGRTGHDAALVLHVGERGFDHQRGQLWGVHVASSAKHLHLAERLPEGSGAGVGMLGGGELLEPGEIRLEMDASHTTPTVWFVWSDEGLDGVAARFHRHLRVRPSHPSSPRPLVLNTWEAAYLQHDPDRMVELARRAAAIGVERFVLDDGWFRGRHRGTRSGLGDWSVDLDTWPDGLRPLVDEVQALGMSFGLWFEPEMASLDSELARNHPDWLLHDPDRRRHTYRGQAPLDLANPAVADHLFARIDALVEEYAVAFLKWDHNRDVFAPTRPDQPTGVHRQTLAAYDLMDRLRGVHPGLEIEVCASGGGRVDLGALSHADRVWASDNNDPLERQQIQRGTNLLVPFELMGTHLGPASAHTTGRTTTLEFRAATALFGHAGIEWNIMGCSEAELAFLSEWTELYRRLRPLIHTGRVVHPEQPTAELLATGVVDEPQEWAVFQFAALDSSTQALGGRLRCSGLAPETIYRVEVLDLLGPATMQIERPSWMDAPIEISGAALETLGLARPLMQPLSAITLELRAV